MIGFEIFLAIGMFTAIVLGLVAIILVARAKLVSSGDVTIQINGEHSLTVPAGGTVRLRRRRHLRAVQVRGGRGRRRDAAHRGVALHPAPGEGGLAPVVPDPGQAGHADPRA